MSSVVEVPMLYVATTTASPIGESDAAATPSVLESRLVGAWTGLEQALLEDLEVKPSQATIAEAYAVLEMLPSNVQPPEPVIEDSGTIAWVWDRWQGKFLALAVNGTGMIQRSAVINGDSSWATTRMLDRLSESDLELVAKFSASHA
jgi:hypothetical protein